MKFAPFCAPFGLSLSKAFLPALRAEGEGRGFDKLSPNGTGNRAGPN